MGRFSLGTTCEFPTLYKTELKANKAHLIQTVQKTDSSFRFQSYSAVQVAPKAYHKARANKTDGIEFSGAVEMSSGRNGPLKSK